MKRCIWLIALQTLLLLWNPGTLRAQCQYFKTVVSGSLGQSTFGIKQDGSLFAWGYNRSGQLGDGTTVNRKIPVAISAGASWRTIAVGSSHTIAVRSDGTLWAWGANNNGQLGDGTSVAKKSPVQIGTSADWHSVAAGYEFSVALKTDGTLWAWGWNNNSQLGDGTTTSKLSPVQVGADTDWKLIATGFFHVLAIKTDGSLWAWGQNVYNQIGDGTSFIRRSPVKIGTDTDWQSITAGAVYSVAIKTGGTMWAWGENRDSQLGDGTNVNRSSPVQIGAFNWRFVSAGYMHNIAIRSDGTLWGWGKNKYGEVGDGSTLERNSPVQIGTATDWLTVATGDYFSLAQKTTGSLMGWGSGGGGQLGNGYAYNPLVPLLSNIYNSSIAAGDAIETVGTIISYNSYIFHVSCNPIAAVQLNNNTGEVTAAVKVITSQPAQFVKRYYEITPAVDAATTQGTVTLYFTNEEFKSFNTQTPVPALLLPDADDAATITARKANLLIEKRSSSGTVQNINPDDNSILWNADASRWEVTFSVTGFSSFYVKTQTQELVLPVSFGPVSATWQGDGLSVSWQTLSETNNDHFIIEASADGKAFHAINKIQSKAEGGNSSVPIDYSLSLDINGAGLGIMLGLGVFAVLLIIPKKNRKWIAAAIVVTIFGFFSCNKTGVNGLSGNEKIFIRIVQVDKDGTKSYSKIITVSKR